MTLLPVINHELSSSLETTISALIITHNEEDNLYRTLRAIEWIPHVLIVDSGSSDRTLTIASEFSNTHVIYRKFDTFALQCNFGLSQLSTYWVLSLDADYVLSPQLSIEIVKILVDKGKDSGLFNGYRAGFLYCINGKAIRSSLLPPRTLLYKRTCARYMDDGHGHRVQITGTIGKLRNKVYHDDRKPLSIWFFNQIKYQKIEAHKLSIYNSHGLAFQDRLRKHTFIAPFAAFIYCICFRGGFLDGKEGFIYALQRLVSESLLYLFLNCSQDERI